MILENLIGAGRAVWAQERRGAQRKRACLPSLSGLLTPTPHSLAGVLQQLLGTSLLHQEANTSVFIEKTERYFFPLPSV